MKRHCKPWRLLWVLLCLPLCLTSCGQDEPPHTAAAPEIREESAAPGASPLVYVPEFYDAEGVVYVGNACVIGEDVYLTGSVEQSDTTVDQDTGESIFTYMCGDALFRAPISGSQFAQWDGYRPFELFGIAGGYTTTFGISPGKDGTIWVNTCAYPYDGGEIRLLQNLDADGNERTRIDLSALTENFSVSAVISAGVDQEDRLYVLTADQVFVFDSSQQPLFALKTKASAGFADRLILLENGQMGLRSGQGDLFAESAGYTLETIDPAAQDWGTSYDLPSGGRKVYPGSGGYLFFCDGGDSLYGYDAESEAYERLLSWTGISVNQEDVLWISALDDARLVVIVRDGAGAETVVLTKTDPATLPETTVLTYGTLQLRSDVRSNIVAFNKSHRDCQIEVVDYSEYNTPEDQSLGLSKLNTELLTGKIDILDTAGIPVRQYASSGILVDLLPFLDNDPDLGRDSLMTRVLEAAMQDGKLYRSFDSFSILSAAGNPDIVGNRMTWTLPDLAAAFAKLPEGSTIFGSQETRETLLEKLLPMELDSFVDWDAGTCSFDSDAFRTLLEFCDAVPAESGGEEEDMLAPAAEGRQLLLCAEFGALDYEYLLYPTVFGGACSFVGYPRSDGATGSCFKLNEGAAITAACKDKDWAWAFVREAFLPRYPTGNYFGMMFPINASDFDRMIELVTTPNYNGSTYVDENGQEAETEAYVILPDTNMPIPVRAITEAEYDQFMELYNAIDTVYSYDKNIFSIVQEEAQAFFCGDKTVEQTMELIQNRASLYIQENRK